LLWLRAGLASPSFSQDRTMEADTPKRWATAPTFNASPVFLAECVAVFLLSVLGDRELLEVLDKILCEYTSIAVVCGLGAKR
jgi:hypothetical protein